MSTVTAEKQPTPINSLQTMQCVIAGKVISTRSHEGRVYTTIVVPAKDEFSSPDFVEVRSTKRVGENEQIVRMTCRVGGFLGKSFPVVDRETGLTRQARACKIMLDVIEA